MAKLRFDSIIWLNRSTVRVPVARFTDGKRNAFFTKGAMLENIELLQQGVAALEKAEAERANNSSRNQRQSGRPDGEETRLAGGGAEDQTPPVSNDREAQTLA